MHSAATGFLRDSRGVTVVEAALSFMVLAILLMGGFETVRYIALTQKLDRVATTIADIGAQETLVDETVIANIMLLADPLSTPFDFKNNGVVILSALERNGAATAEIVLQGKGGGLLEAESQIGAPEETPNLPSNLTLKEDDQAIVVEVLYNFEPAIAANLFPSHQIYRQAFYRSRYASTFEPPEPE